MPSPFPGMNPYLEHPAFWSSFHFRLVNAVLSSLDKALPSHYYTEIKTQTYQVLEGSAEDEEGQWVRNHPAASPAYVPRSLDEESDGIAVMPPLQSPQSVVLPMMLTLKERYLEIRELSSEAVITVVKILTPRNKRQGRGRMAYQRQRDRILTGSSHLVEIDLLRRELPLPMLGAIGSMDYRILVSRAERRPKADLYGFDLSDSIPSFPVPLKPEGTDLSLELQLILDDVFERARYTQRIDYQHPVPLPLLTATQQAWVDELLIPIRGGYGTTR
jgi:Protein of unknown function (DUF4058)